MIWKIKAYSKWLILTGIVLLCLLALSSLLIIPAGNFSEFFSGLILSALLIYLTIRSLDIILNPVLLRLDSDGVYLRGKVFIPYEDVLAFTKERRLFPQAGGYIDIYKLILHPSTGLSVGEIFFKTRFFVIPFKDKNGVVLITFPSSYTTDPAYGEVLGEMFEKYRNKTGNLLSSNYYPDLYKERNV